MEDRTPRSSGDTEEKQIREGKWEMGGAKGNKYKIKYYQTLTNTVNVIVKLIYQSLIFQENM